MKNDSPPQESPPAARPKPFVPGVTLLSLSTILLGLFVIGFMIQVGNVHAGASFLIGGLFSLPLRPVMFVVPLVLLSGLVFALTKKSLYTRAEMVCVLSALLLAPPIMTEGFWAYAVGGMVTIPQTSDMAKLDGYSEKMWPHGDNLLAGALGKEQAQSLLVPSGALSWSEFEVNAGRQKSVPVLENSEPGDVSTIRIPVSLFAGDTLQLFLDEPYLLTLLARASALEAESYYYCRIYYDDEQDFATEVFFSREEGDISYLQPGGFVRKGRYGVTFAPSVQETVYIELGLVGRGTVAFADLSLMSVSVITEMYDGRKIVSLADFDALPAKLRGRVLVRPESMFSWAGFKLILTGCIPLQEWLNPAIFWFGYIALLLMGTLAIAVIMRKQWLENERYPLPVAQIPIRLLGLGSADEDTLATSCLPSVWKNQLMWVGFAVTLFWCVMKIWAAYNANVPNLSINAPISPYFSDPSWGSMWSNVNFKVCSIFLALAIFMELNVLMTIVIGFFLYRAQYWIGHSYGLTSTAGYPFQAEQMNGSYLMYAILVIFFTRKYLWQVFKRAARGGCIAGEEQEVMSYRACVIMLLLCYAGVTLWAGWAGVGIAGMLVFYTVMLLISFVAAKLRAECGIPFSTYFPWSVLMLVPLLGGHSLFVPSGFIFIAMVTEMFVIRSFLLLPGIQIEVIELGRRARVVPRHLLYVCILGVFGAWMIGGWFTLSNSYTTGMDTAASVNKTHWFRHYGTYAKKADVSAAEKIEVTASGQSSEPREAESNPALWGMVYGAGTVTVVTVLRQFFAGFWFHPIGLIVGPSWMIQEAWGSLFLAWLIRFAVLKLGGAATVRNKLLPFATGIFLGGTMAYLIYAVSVSYLKFFVPGTKSVWWSIWAL